MNWVYEWNIKKKGHIWWEFNSIQFRERKKNEIMMSHWNWKERHKNDGTSLF